MNGADLIAKLTQENEELKNRSEFLSRDLSEAQSQLASFPATPSDTVGRIRELEVELMHWKRIKNTSAAKVWDSTASRLNKYVMGNKHLDKYARTDLLRWIGLMFIPDVKDLIDALARPSKDTSTITPVFDDGIIMCSGCGHVIGKTEGEKGQPSVDEYYGPRCPGCGKLIDREGK